MRTCESICSAGFSQQAQQIAMMACIHSGQAAFARNFIGITGMAVGLGAGVVTFGGIIAGSYGFIAVGSAMGTSAAVINSTGHVMDGNYLAIPAEFALAGMSKSHNLVLGARNITATEKVYLNMMLHKSLGVGQLGIQIGTHQP
jgi:hypothetical protein